MHEGAYMPKRREPENRGIKRTDT